MINRKELKLKAKDYAFNNKWVIWKPILIFVLLSIGISLLGGLISGIFNNKVVNLIINIIVSLATLPISFAMVEYIMKAIHGKEVNITDVFVNKYKLFVPILIMAIVMSVIVGIGFILLIIPGIILALRYAMTGYLVAEAEENLDAIATLKKSAKMMDGHKWEYFVFQLSFIGWLILGELTLGILYIWVVPYMTTANIYYFEELKKLEK